jgi:hypothetical protein
MFCCSSCLFPTLFYNGILVLTLQYTVLCVVVFLFAYIYIVEAILSRIMLLEQKIDNLAVEHNISEYDIWSEGGRSVAEQADFKRKLIAYYNRGPNAFHRNKLKCMGTGQWLRKDKVIAGHIWMSKMHGRGLAKFNLAPFDCTSERNGLLVVKGIEAAFDKKHLCLIYNSFRKFFSFYVLNPNIKDTVIPDTNPPMKFSDIHSTRLRHPDGKIPFRRLLSFHAKCSFQCALRKEWISDAEFNRYEPYHTLSDGASVPDTTQTD